MPYNHYSKNTTVTVKKARARHPSNQPGLDRLQELLVKATANSASGAGGGGQNYATTIQRALRSLKDCRHPIVTQQDAVKLKYVGPAMAKKICPPEASSGPGPLPQKRKRDAPTEPRRWEPCVDRGVLPGRPDAPPPVALCPVPALRSARSAPCGPKNNTQRRDERHPTAKEAAYWAARKHAEALAVAPKALEGTWKVVLLVDNREHRSKQVVSSCKQAGIPCEERQLAIGDMAWIARKIPSSKKKDRAIGKGETETGAGETALEVLVGTIVERKEVGDLASSLFGTRYAEQRLRLSQCGLPQVLFLVEGDLHALSNCPAETLEMAMMETRLQLGFSVVRTRNLPETVGILKTLHARIVQRTFPSAFGRGAPKGNRTGSTSGTIAKPQKQALPSFGGGNRRRPGSHRRPASLLELVFDTPPVPAFGGKRFVTYPELRAKVEVDRERGTKSVRALTLAMLKQIPTLSQKKCTALAGRYPTLRSLMEALTHPGRDNDHQSGNDHSESNGHNGNNDGDNQPPQRRPRPRLLHHPKQIVGGIEIEGGHGRTIGPSSAAEVYAACCTLPDGSTVDCHRPHEPKVQGVARGRSRSRTTATTTNATTTTTTTTAMAATTATRTVVSSSVLAASTARGSQAPPTGPQALLPARGTVQSDLEECVAVVGKQPSRSKVSIPEAVAAVARKDSLLFSSSPIGGDDDEDLPFRSNRIPANRKATSVAARHADATRHTSTQQQETVDLLTPEASRHEPKRAANIGRLSSSSGWSSDSSNDTPAATAVTKFSANANDQNNKKTSATRETAQSNSEKSATSITNAVRKPPTAQSILLLSSSSEDETDNDNDNDNDNAFSLGGETRKKAPRLQDMDGNAQKRSNHSDVSNGEKTTAAIPSRNGPSSGGGRPAAERGLPTTPPVFSGRQREAPAAAAESSASPSSDGSSVLWSPEDGGFTPVSLRGGTGAGVYRRRPDPAVAGVVSLLDDDDSDTNHGGNEQPKPMTAAGSHKTSHSQNTRGTDKDREDTNATNRRRWSSPRKESLSKDNDDNDDNDDAFLSKPAVAGAANASEQGASLLLLPTGGRAPPPPGVTTKRGSGRKADSPALSLSSGSDDENDLLGIGSSLRERLENKMARGGANRRDPPTRQQQQLQQPQEVIEID